MNATKINLAVLLACLLLGGCGGVNPSKDKSATGASPAVASTTAPAGRSKNLPPGVHDESLASETGEVLRYTLSIPAGYDPGQPAPLIVALHFGGKVTPHFSRAMLEGLILPALGELDAIILAPDSIAGPWNNDKNEQAVLELMKYVGENYNIDRAKTLLTGFSMGGYGTWYLGSRHQDLFSALIPIAGAPLVDENVVWTTPIYVIHSRADDVVPIDETEKYLAGLNEEQRRQIKFVAVDDLAHFQTATFAKPLSDAVPWLKQVWHVK
jgi:predicted peptidase